MYSESMHGTLKRREWHVDGFVVSECGGFMHVDGLGNLPPGWYTVEVGWDEARSAPTLAITNISDPDEYAPTSTTCLIHRPNQDASVTRVYRDGYSAGPLGAMP